MSKSPPQWQPPKHNFMQWYILKYRKPIPCDNVDIIQKHMRKHAYKRVRSTYIGKYWVSTVFLFLDHNTGLGNSDPILFETMCFEDSDMSGDDCTRAGTWREALKNHWAMVNHYKQEVKKNGKP